MTRIVCAVLASLLAVVSAAEADDLSYSYLEVLALKGQADNGPDSEGFGLGASAELSSHIYAFGGYTTVEYDTFLGIDVDSDSWVAGVGYHRGIADRISIFGNVGYLDAEAESNLGMSISDDGIAASLGLRGLVGSRLELGGAVNYVTLDRGDDDTSFSANALLNLTSAFSLIAGYATTDDAEGYSLGLRVYWDK